MADYSELKRMAERSILGHPSAPTNLHDLNWAGSVYRANTRPHVVLDLLSEVGRLREERDSQQRLAIRAMEERNQLNAEVEALRKDAERLTWLEQSREIDSVGPTLCCGKNLPSLREAVDAAMKMEVRYD